MKIQLGIVAPFLLEIAILLLYSTIRYEEINSSILILILLIIFPSVLIYVLSPFLIITISKMRLEISERLNSEFDKLVIQSTTSIDESRTMIDTRPSWIKKGDDPISASLKNKLIPILTHRAIYDYRDSFYARKVEHPEEQRLEYYEALVLFSILSGSFLILNTIVLVILGFTSINLFLITLDQIIEPAIILGIALVFFISFYIIRRLFIYAKNRLLHYLPLAIPILFVEDQDEQFYRRETIRSYLNYNLDNLTDRMIQKQHQKLFSKTLKDLVEPLLWMEYKITARMELAHKLAWKAYLEVMEEDELLRKITMESPLQRLLLGEKIGEIEIEQSKLLGLNSDLEYIQEHLQNWSNKSIEGKTLVYFRLYRVLEYTLRSITETLEILREEDEYNFFSAIQSLANREYIDDDEKSVLHNLRHRRNKLMHEPGVELNVSRDVVEQVLATLNNLLTKLEN